MAEAMIYLLIYLVLCTPLGLMVAAAGLKLLPFLLVPILTIGVLRIIAKMKKKQEKEGKKSIKKIILIIVSIYIINWIISLGIFLFWYLKQ